MTDILFEQFTRQWLGEYGPNARLLVKDIVARASRAMFEILTRIAPNSKDHYQVDHIALGMWLGQHINGSAAGYKLAWRPFRNQKLWGLTSDPLDPRAKPVADWSNYIPPQPAVAAGILLSCVAVLVRGGYI
jgi:hypothetical protein